MVTFYQENTQQLTQIGGLYLLPLSAVAFLWFTAALREWVEQSTRKFDHMLSTVQMLSGVSFITLALAAAGAATVVSLSHDVSVPIDPELARHCDAGLPLAELPETPVGRALDHVAQQLLDRLESNREPPA